MIVIYFGMQHKILREFEYKGVLKVELKNLHNKNQFVINKSELE